MKILKILETVKNFIKKNKKLVTVVSAMFCAVVLVAGSIAGTIAYLTSTASVQNTFTVGNIKITMDETKVDLYGEAVTPATRTTSNEYKLIPGHEYKKDPTIHVEAGSEACWLFVKVENGIASYEAEGNKIAAQLTANGWTALDGVANVYWHAVVDARDSAQDIKVFDEFILANSANFSGLTDAQIAALKINVTAYAMQSNGFTTDAADVDAKNAWDAANFS